ncbi:biopolymer transporter ExbD [Ruficoccus amylovorans]|uniref:Biopolymer transporter ExbD n=1 Tax=Ruficoccus amylovorans TaxID=1804625 RepID=A0A842HBS4_9BACT|nr:biopolymer transporter ExbD [Ruficoccus amylovorans]MBC2593014.1 biopolymer transporter ExbD [Ruficoccus amylovorans]
MSLTRPLELERHLSPPDARFDVAALFDVLLICIMFMLLGSRFIFAPGESIRLPVMDNPAPAGISTLAVLTYKSDEMMILNGRVITLEGWQRLIERGEVTGEGVLLVKADAELPMQTLLELAELARQAGYEALQIAANSSVSDKVWKGQGSAEPFGSYNP